MTTPDPKLTEQFIPPPVTTRQASHPSRPRGQSAIDWHDFDYKEFGAEPKIQFSTLTLIILSPALICLHIFIARFFGIPILQYSFVTMLVAFLINYTLIIRKYELMPFLPVQSFDYQLKLICVIGLAGILCSMAWGWNGSGGIIFAILWEQIRGNKLGNYGYYFAVIIIGSLLMEQTYTWMKLIQFIPGMLFGYCNSTLYTLKSSSTYAITHQFVFLCTVGLPVFFPASTLIVPSLFQWILMIACGVLLLFTVVITIKLMQTARVSVSMGVLSGIMMLGTSRYTQGIDWAGAVCIILGVIVLIKKEYIDYEY